MENKVKKANELMYHILDRNITEKGLARMIGVLLWNMHIGVNDIIDNRKTAEFEVLANLKYEENVHGYLDALLDTCKVNNEIKQTSETMETDDWVSISLTKEQWEEVYQWYLCTRSDYGFTDFEDGIGNKIAEVLKARYGTFR